MARQDTGKAEQMTGTYQVVIFDVDGTLLDTTQGVSAAVEYTIAAAGLAPLPREQIVSFIGPPVQDSFRRIYGIEGARLQELAAIFRNRYKDYELLKAVPYPGIYQTMEHIRKLGTDIAVATYKRQDYAETILKHFGFDQYTTVIYGADHENKLKKVDIMQKCMTKMGVSAAGEAVMVGDSSHDAMGAEQLGMDFIGVTYGFELRSGEDVMRAGAIGSADKPEEILHFLTETGAKEDSIL